MAISVNVSGTWRSSPKQYVNVSGTWKDVYQVYTNVSGSWKPMYSYWYSTGAWSGCSANCGGGTQTRTVTCYRTGNVSFADSYCAKYGLTKPNTSQSCNTQACADCRFTYDSTNCGYPNMCNYYVLQTTRYLGNNVNKTVFGWGADTGFLGIVIDGHVSSTTSSGYVYYLGTLQYYDRANSGNFFQICRRAA